MFDIAAIQELDSASMNGRLLRLFGAGKELFWIVRRNGGSGPSN